MENKVSDNVIEKNYRECLKFNEINESGACNFDMATAKAARGIPNNKKESHRVTPPVQSENIHLNQYL